MTRAHRFLVPLFLASASAIAACGGGSSEEAPQVAWGTKYAESAQTRIDGKAEAGDCEGLQKESEIAAGNNDLTVELTGSGTEDLMSYIEYQKGQAGCSG